MNSWHFFVLAIVNCEFNENITIFALDAKPNHRVSSFLLLERNVSVSSNRIPVVNSQIHCNDRNQVPEPLFVVEIDIIHCCCDTIRYSCHCSYLSIDPVVARRVRSLRRTDYLERRMRCGQGSELLFFCFFAIVLTTSPYLIGRQIWSFGSLTNRERHHKHHSLAFGNQNKTKFFECVD